MAVTASDFSVVWYEDSNSFEGRKKVTRSVPSASAVVDPDE